MSKTTMELEGIEPSSLQCKCRILPLKYNPIFSNVGIEPTYSMCKTDTLTIEIIAYISRRKGIEPLSTVLETNILPLNYLLNAYIGIRTQNL
jgi:hypothetical protein